MTIGVGKYILLRKPVRIAKSKDTKTDERNIWNNVIFIKASIFIVIFTFDGEESVPPAFVHLELNIAGYGNLVPSSNLGRLLMIAYALIGIPINGIVLATLAEFFSKAVSTLVRLT